MARTSRILITGDARSFLTAVRQSEMAVAGLQRKVASAGMVSSTPSSTRQLQRSQTAFVKAAQDRVVAASKATQQAEKKAARQAASDARAVQTKQLLQQKEAARRAAVAADQFVVHTKGNESFLVTSEQAAKRLAGTTDDVYRAHSRLHGAVVENSQGARQLLTNVKVAEEFAKRSGGSVRAFNLETERALAGARRGAAPSITAFKELGVATHQVDQAMKGARKSADGMNFSRGARGALAGAGAFTQLGRSIAYASASFLAFAVLSGVFRSAIAAAADFHQSLTRIVGLAGGARPQVEKFGQAILRMAPKVGTGPRELADALYFIASAGIRASKQMSVLTLSAKASASGLGETKVVADAVTSAMNAYGQSQLTAAQATNVLVDTVHYGKGEAEAFAPVIGTVASFAAALGVRFHEVGAALAVMTRLGIPAYTAAIELQAVFSNMLHPTVQADKALTSLAKKAGVGAVSFKSLVAQLKTQGFLSVLVTLHKIFKDNDAAISQVFTNVRALRGVLAIVGKNVGANVEVFRKMAGSSHALAIAFGAVSKDPAYRFRALKATIESMEVAIGSALLPSVIKVGSALGTWLSKPGNIERMNKSVQDMAHSFTTLVKGVLTLLAPLFALLRVAKNLTGGWGNFFKVVLAGWALLHVRAKLFGDTATTANKRAAVSSAGEWIKANMKIRQSLGSVAGAYTRSIGKFRGEQEALRNAATVRIVRQPSGPASMVMPGRPGFVSPKSIFERVPGVYTMRGNPTAIRVKFVSDTGAFDQGLQKLRTSVGATMNDISARSKVVAENLADSIGRIFAPLTGRLAGRLAARSAENAAEAAAVPLQQFRGGMLQAPGRFVSRQQLVQPQPGGPLFAEAFRLGLRGNVSAPGRPPGGAQLMRVRIVPEPGQFSKAMSGLANQANQVAGSITSTFKTVSGAIAGSFGEVRAAFGRLAASVGASLRAISSSASSQFKSLKGSLASSLAPLKEAITGRVNVGREFTPKLDPGPIRSSLRSIGATMRATAASGTKAFAIAFGRIAATAEATSVAMFLTFRFTLISIGKLMASAFLTVGWGLLLFGVTEFLFHLKDIVHWLFGGATAAQKMNEAMGGLNANLSKTSALSKQLTSKKAAVTVAQHAVDLATQNRAAAEAALARGGNVRQNTAVVAQMVEKEFKAKQQLLHANQGLYSVQEKLDQQNNARPGEIKKTTDEILAQNSHLRALMHDTAVAFPGTAVRRNNKRIEDIVNDLKHQADKATGFAKKVDMALSTIFSTTNKPLKPMQIRMIVQMAVKGKTVNDIVRDILGLGSNAEQVRLRGRLLEESPGGARGSVRPRPQPLPFTPGDDSTQFAVPQNLLLRQAKAAASGSQKAVDAANKAVIAWIKHVMSGFKLTDKQATDAFNTIAGLRSQKNAQFAIKPLFQMREARAAVDGSQREQLALLEKTREWIQTQISAGKHTKDWLTAAFQALGQYDEQITQAINELPLGVQLGQAKAGSNVAKEIKATQAAIAFYQKRIDGLLGAGFPALKGKARTKALVDAYNNLSQYQQQLKSLTEKQFDIPKGLQLKEATAAAVGTKQTQLKVAREILAYIKGIIAAGKLGIDELIAARQAQAQAKEQIKELKTKQKQDFKIPIGLQIAEAKAGATGTEKQQKAINQRIIAFIRKQIASGKLHGDALVNAYQELGSRIVKSVSEHAQLIKDATSQISSAIDEARSQIGQLFHGPLLDPSQRQKQMVLGLRGPAAGDLTNDINAQVDEYLKFDRALKKLAKRGAPKKFVEELRAMGPDAMPEVQALVKATPKQFKALLAAVQRREEAARHVALVQLHSDKVDMYAKSIALKLTDKQLKSFSDTGKLPRPEHHVVKRAIGGVTPGAGGGDTVPAMLTPGEVVFNAKQQKKLAGQLGIPASPHTLFSYVNNLPGHVRGFAGGGIIGALKSVALAPVRAARALDRIEHHRNLVRAAQEALTRMLPRRESISGRVGTMAAFVAEQGFKANMFAKGEYGYGGGPRRLYAQLTGDSGKFGIRAIGEGEHTHVSRGGPFRRMRAASGGVARFAGGGVVGTPDMSGGSRFKGGGVAPPAALRSAGVARFKDLTDNQKRANIVSGLQRGRMSLGEAQKAFAFWHLNLPPALDFGPRAEPANRAHDESQVSWTYHRLLRAGMDKKTANQTVRKMFGVRTGFWGFVSRLIGGPQYRGSTKGALVEMVKPFDPRTSGGLLNLASFFIGPRGEVAGGAFKLGLTHQLRPGKEIYWSGGWKTIKQATPVVKRVRAGKTIFGSQKYQSVFTGMKIVPERGKAFVIPKDRLFTAVRGTEAKVAHLHGTRASFRHDKQHFNAGDRVLWDSAWQTVRRSTETAQGVKIVPEKGPPFLIPKNKLPWPYVKVAVSPRATKESVGAHVLTENLRGGRQVFRGGKWQTVKTVDRTPKGTMVTPVSGKPFLIPKDQRFVRARANPEDALAMTRVPRDAKPKVRSPRVARNRSVDTTENLRTPAAMSKQVSKIDKDISLYSSILRDILDRVIGTNERSLLPEIMKKNPDATPVQAQKMAAAEAKSKLRGYRKLAEVINDKIAGLQTERTVLKSRVATVGGRHRTLRRVGKVKALFSDLGGHIRTLGQARQLVTDPMWGSGRQGAVLRGKLRDILQPYPEFRFNSFSRGQEAKGARGVVKGVDIEWLRDKYGAKTANMTIQAMIRGWIKARNTAVVDVMGAAKPGNLLVQKLSPLERSLLKQLYAEEGKQFRFPGDADTHGHIPRGSKKMVHDQTTHTGPKRGDSERGKKKFALNAGPQWRRGTTRIGEETVPENQWLWWRLLKPGDPVVSYKRSAFDPAGPRKVLNPGKVTEVRTEGVMVQWEGGKKPVYVSEPAKNLRREGGQLEPPPVTRQRPSRAGRGALKPREYVKYPSETVNLLKEHPNLRVWHDRHWNKVDMARVLKRDNVLSVKSGDNTFTLPLDKHVRMRFADGGVVPKTGDVASKFAKDAKRLARGALVTGRTEAIIGESGPEMVVPLQKLSPGGVAKNLPGSKLVNFKDQASEVSKVGSGTVNMTARTVNIRMTRPAGHKEFSPEINVYVDGEKRKATVKTSTNSRRGGGKPREGW